jgi:hypothetical protein
MSRWFFVSNETKDSNVSFFDTENSNTFMTPPLCKNALNTNEASADAAEASADDAEASADAAEASADAAEDSADAAEGSADAAEASADDAEASADAAEASADAAEASADAAEASAPPRRRSEASADDAEASADAAEASADAAEASADAAEASADAAEDSADAAEASADAAEASADAAEASANTAEDSADAAEANADAAEANADAAEASADAAEDSADTAEDSADAAEDSADTAEASADADGECTKTDTVHNTLQSLSTSLHTLFSHTAPNEECIDEVTLPPQLSDSDHVDESATPVHFFNTLLEKDTQYAQAFRHSKSSLKIPPRWRTSSVEVQTEDSWRVQQQNVQIINEQLRFYKHALNAYKNEDFSGFPILPEFYEEYIQFGVIRELYKRLHTVLFDLRKRDESCATLVESNMCFFFDFFESYMESQVVDAHLYVDVQSARADMCEVQRSLANLQRDIAENEEKNKSVCALQSQQQVTVESMEIQIQKLKAECLEIDRRKSELETECIDADARHTHLLKKICTRELELFEVDKRIEATRQEIGELRVKAQYMQQHWLEESGLPQSVNAIEQVVDNLEHILKVLPHTEYLFESAL